MEMSEEHSYAAAALIGMGLPGELALIFETSPITVFYSTLIGGVAGIYLYAYSLGEEE